MWRLRLGTRLIAGIFVVQFVTVLAAASHVADLPPVVHAFGAAAVVTNSVGGSAVATATRASSGVRRRESTTMRRGLRGAGMASGGSRQVSWGLSASTVPTPTSTAS